ncbi:MAG TPA: hypothetical protein VLX67_06485 [Stellaceae bacterium]|nr:hypothetical protein [Stellaceae bacterium]
MPLPTDANVDFLVCDAVRQTPDGKLDLAGFFPTGEVRLDPSAKLPAALNLTFVVVLKDGDGVFRPTIRISDPLGKELHAFEIPEFSKAAGQAHIMMLPVERIPIANAGAYTISFEISGQTYRRSVRIFQ